MRKNKGFTLIELLVVMAIIAILAMVGIANYRSSQIKARDARRKSDLAQMQKSLEMYYNDNGVYPLEGTEGKIAGCVGDCDWGLPWSKDGVLYLKTMPIDPRGQYCYSSPSGDGTDYILYAILENVNDPDLITPEACSGANYNYKVTSSNVPVTP